MTVEINGEVKLLAIKPIHVYICTAFRSVLYYKILSLVFGWRPRTCYLTMKTYDHLFPTAFWWWPYEEVTYESSATVHYQSQHVSWETMDLVYKRREIFSQHHSISDHNKTQVNSPKTINMKCIAVSSKFEK